MGIYKKDELKQRLYIKIEPIGGIINDYRNTKRDKG